MKFGELEVSAKNLEKIERSWSVDLVMKLEKDLTLRLNKLLFSGLRDMFKPAFKWLWLFRNNFVCNP